MVERSKGLYLKLLVPIQPLSIQNVYILFWHGFESQQWQSHFEIAFLIWYMNKFAFVVVNIILQASAWSVCRLSEILFCISNNVCNNYLNVWHLWRNGRAYVSRPKGWVFKSHSEHIFKQLPAETVKMGVRVTLGWALIIKFKFVHWKKY